MSIRQRLYVDGLWLAQQACHAVDASINWVDVASLARRVGCAEPMNACYFGLCDPEDPASEAPIRVLALALEASGVVCHIRREPSQSLECERCGHGWEHPPVGLLAAELALQVAEDAACDEIDRALILSDPQTVGRIERLFARCYPSKQVEALEPNLSELRQLRLSRAVQLMQGTTLLQPSCWSTPRRRQSRAVRSPLEAY
jgi:hypothetical protein